jgi:homoserine kinase
MLLQHEKLIVKVPASTANVGSGFDSIGIAFQLYITIEVEVADSTQFCWQGGALNGITIADKDNLILKGLEHVFQLLKQERPEFKVTVTSNIPLTRGLGSSASAYVAGLIAANVILNKPLSDNQLLWLATEEEGHPDNVGASIFGGIFIASVDWEKKNVLYHRQDFPDKWRWLAAIPSYTLSTTHARNLIPEQYSKDATLYNLSRYGLLVASLMTGSSDGVRRGLEDALHQPFRKHLIPGFEELVQLKDKLHAIGFIISGAGPTVLGLVKKEVNQEIVMQKMKELMTVQNHDIAVQPLMVENYGYSVQRIEK